MELAQRNYEDLVFVMQRDRDRWAASPVNGDGGRVLDDDLEAAILSLTRLGLDRQLLLAIAAGRIRVFDPRWPGAEFRRMVVERFVRRRR
ncbi:hypothetical protein FOS14_19900 [Skermania sp. ID1734]|uniref:hypothetical protein n=1 Tax=Skermania sp. ID1734 TaxID=2597516 RepID=UPI00117E973B|nr:hypothetical protein [Skermania sp. ID1734]TSD94904.1 hypothetical protein FOS14_19900 [Skermania sp. ID1734]